MKFSYTFLLLLLWGCPIFGSDQAHYNDGKNAGIAESQLPDKAAGLPGADGVTPQTKYLKNPALMTGDASTLFKQGSENSEDVTLQVSGTLQEAANQRPQFIFTENDPLIVAGDKVVNRALDEIKATAHPGQPGQNVFNSTHECEEAREPTQYSCRITREVEIKPTEGSKTFNFVVPNYGKWQQLKQFIASKVFEPSHFTHYDPSTLKTIKPNIPTLPQDMGPIKEVVINKVFVHSFSLSPINEGNVTPNTFAPINTRKHYVSPCLRVEVKVIYQKKISSENIVEREVSACDVLENKCDLGLCEYTNETIIEAGERIIHGLRISKPWWIKERTYTCSYPSKNNCGEFRLKGCSQVKSECKTWLEGACVEYTQTFQCEERLESAQGSSLKGNVPFCLDSNCDEHAWAPNQDFAEAASKLVVLREMQNNMSKNPFEIFKGDKRSCCKDCLGFRDCCGTGNGWGQNLGYSCSAEEKQLSELRQNKKCVLVGTYCAEKALGKCVRKKTTFCCFGSKLVRLVQEQGRSQLGINWGAPKAPVCRGLTVEEISRVDFSKLDLSEIFAEIMAKTKQPDFQKFTNELQQSSVAKFKAIKGVAEKNSKRLELKELRENQETANQGIQQPSEQTENINISQPDVGQGGGNDIAM